ncbi:helix-turn-helix domain-containing protein [Flammeovirga sp. EKP202]|uniref:helix-turn-helix domain-containing protein n=1 Tax=Flammeovirga sp. EKP202 TaxID=2770592 RepID=UPI00165EC2C9|nr:helix-turn-helix domain-containing protein [Flammeovirga sp. EKP202]MBD0403284.1 AraC family transcriptional regulator [Flammeovirga sp. EKP202]
MKHFKTISEYYKSIGLSEPDHPHFDIKSFEENMGKVKTKMLPFRHEFYFIGLRIEGKGQTHLGHSTELPEGISIFFNSPFQIISWDHSPDWEGYYVLFSQDFLASSYRFEKLLDDYPFLKIDQAVPFEIDKDELPDILNIYEKIKEEYTNEREDKISFIEIYVLLLLNQVKRVFNKSKDKDKINNSIQKADLAHLSRFETLVESSFYPDAEVDEKANLHSPAYYAEILNIHPNHLNAVVKSITGQTALNYIHNHILKLAKAALSQTSSSAKEIAYSLYFDSPSHFGAFFKKNTGLTPIAYRKK